MTPEERTAFNILRLIDGQPTGTLLKQIEAEIASAVAEALEEEQKLRMDWNYRIECLEKQLAECHASHEEMIRRAVEEYRMGPHVHARLRDAYNEGQRSQIDVQTAKAEALEPYRHYTTGDGLMWNLIDGLDAMINYYHTEGKREAYEDAANMVEIVRQSHFDMRPYEKNIDWPFQLGELANNIRALQPGDGKP